MLYKELYRKAAAMIPMAYAPFSKFKVGAALLTKEGEAWPCGICRQFMKEFCEDDFKIITGSDEDSLRVYTMEELFPEGFRL